MRPYLRLVMVSLGVAATMVFLSGCSRSDQSVPQTTTTTVMSLDVEPQSSATQPTAATSEQDTVSESEPTGQTLTQATTSDDSGDQPDDAGITPAGDALSSIFSPARAPERRTMGLLQRTFLDIAADGDQDLELAVVIDGTDSMATELAGVRRSIHQMLADLRKFRGGQVRTAIVVYRDAASPSGAVSIPLNTFTADQAAIEKAVESLSPESGAPYFHELPDLGLYRAIGDLPWSADDQVTKWILMFGDAPPYAESRSDTDATAGKRRYGTDLLIGAARSKGIRVNCILCISSDNVSDSYAKAVDETRTFMSRIASETGGLMLDLSNPAARAALADAAKQPQIEYAKINPITAINLASVRRDDIRISQGDHDAVRPVSIAVLPHLPLEQIRTSAIDPNLRAVQISTALRMRLNQVTGVKVASPVDIQRQLRRLRVSGGDSSQALRGLASRLGVDYVVWGSMAAGGATYQTAAYRRDNGNRVVQVDLPGNADQGTWAQLFLTAASEQTDDQEAIGRLLDRIEQDNDLKQGLATPLSANPSTSGELLKALESLEQALAYDTRSDQSAELLKMADQASQSAATAEPDNPLAHWLQANVAYNQAAQLFQRGNKQQASQRMKQMRSSLNRAVNLRQRIAIPSLLTEVQADFLLLVRRDTPQAIENYQTLTGLDQPLQSQLRGHWMLAGIYAGDWGNAGSPNVDPEKARYHVMQIMANWPESPQAKLLRRWLKYDETTQETEFNYLPMVNIELTQT